MTVLPRLLKVGSMAESLGLYLPAVILQKSIALGRVLLFAYLLSKVQYGLWGLGMMIFNVAAPLLSLGSNHGLIRYVSFYEARGRLREFYRRMRLAVLACAVGLTLVALAGSGLIARYVVASRAEAGEVPYRVQLHLCWLALANALAGALYHNMLSFMVGMRAYRLLSLVEVLFAVAFTALGAAMLWTWPTALALLGAHLAAMVLVLAAGMSLLHVAVGRPALAEARAPSAGRADLAVLPPGGESDEVTGQAFIPLGPAQAAAPERVQGVLGRVLRYGLAALAGALLWQGAGYVSFWLTSRQLGKADAGVFYVFLLLAQPTVFLAGAAWAVLFSHVARQWEAQRRPAAMLRLTATYKAVCLATLTLSVAIYAGSPLWVRLLPEGYRSGLGLVGGLLMFYAAMNHLGLMNMLARLHERPAVISLAALAGGAANVVLALWWMPARGPAGAAWAAGVGMCAGGGIVAAAYLRASREPAGAGSYLMLVLPALMLLPILPLIVVWAVVLAAAAFLPWPFTPAERKLLVGLLRPERKAGCNGGG